MVIVAKKVQIMAQSNNRGTIEIFSLPEFGDTAILKHNHGSHPKKFVVMDPMQKVISVSFVNLDNNIATIHASNGVKFSKDTKVKLFF